MYIYVITKSFHCVTLQEFEELWSDLEVVYDGGKLGTNEEQRLGSTVVNLSDPGRFKIIRPGR